MNVQKLNVFTLLLAAAVLPGAAPLLAQAQERAIAVEAETLPVRPAACPAPFMVTLNANTPNALASDVPRGVNYQTSLNYTQPDKAYIHTFVWRHEQKCCQVTGAMLTVKMKALLPGQAANSSDAGNDDIAIVHAGQVVQPFNERIYNGPRPFPAGQMATKNWTLNPAALGILNSTGTLTLYVEDDTSVISAELKLTGCCLTN